jgi:hypothetical protein
MKVIELKLNKDTKGTGEGITAISLVEFPAIEKNWIAFNKEGKKLKPSKQFEFKTIDEEQRILAGPAMIPDKLIYRRDEISEEEFFVFFTADTIRELSESFIFSGKQNSLTLEHDSTLNELSVVESWIVEDPEKDKSSFYGFDLPVGSWFIKVKILNDDIWNLVKDNSIKGFSVEGVFAREIIKQNKKMKKDKSTKTIDFYLNKIKAKFNEANTEEEKPEAEAFGSINTTTADGTEITISYPGDTLEAGAAITHEVEGEQVPVPTGEYILEDGRTLVVAEEGIAGEIKEGEEMKKDGDEPSDNSDGLKEEQINALVDGIAEIIANFQKETTERIDKGMKGIEDKLRAEFNQPGAEHQAPTPEDKDLKQKAIQGLNKFVRETNKK